ncbi:hypothetical protein AQUCO_02000513v1 [Aquilegia coerulea]|uniref:Copper transport protein n=1 Tax=Aquilegia coerulea TaxID=218851 RepID=A0A2G5DIQ8_AQUCA|nr:hypothetical protein AQUCO_02000513v1 [Aquilegia coerulea]
MMHMTFYWGNKVTLLFDSWKTDSYLSYFITLLVCFLFSVFYQYMEDRRIRFKIISNSKKSSSSSNSSIESPLLTRLKINQPARYATSLLFAINSAIGYMLMLAIMSFNGGVFIAIVLGLAFGYLLFRTGDEEVVVLENPCACV